jgi:PAS domain S-box-containing protein
MLFLSDDGTIIEANLAAVQAYGYNHDEMLAMRVSDLRWPHDWVLTEQQQQEASADGILFETMHVRRDGSTFPVEVGSRGVMICGQMVTLCIVRDITDRKRAEEALRSSEAETKQHNRELSMLNAAMAVLHDTRELPEMLRRLRDLLSKDSEVTWGRLSILDDERGSPSLNECWDSGNCDIEVSALMSHASQYSAMAIQQAQMISVACVGDSIVHANGELVAGAGKLPLYVCLPLLAEGIVQGSIELIIQPACFLRRSQASFFEVLGQQVGVGVRKALLYEESVTSRHRLGELSQKLVSVQENERRHLARELHDEFGAVVTALSIAIGDMSRALPEQSRNASDKAIRWVGQLARLTRRLSLDLRPIMLDDVGLVPTLVWYFEQYTNETSIRVDFRYAGMEGRLHGDLETAVYRIVQEALTNTARHARVPEVTVVLYLRHGVLHLQIEDEGVGFEVESALARSDACGLVGIRERVYRLGGDFVLRSDPGSGTCLSVALPVAGDANAGVRELEVT